jgi:cation diffusion facilitator CzcD-associated flavoprotein CzcO
MPVGVTTPAAQTVRREVGAVVVGGGISGIAAVVRLRRDAGMRTWC